MELGGDRKYLAQFIECYKNHPPLWDSSSPEYMNKEKKIAGYNDLLKILKKMKNNATIDDVRKKINTLRSCYRRESKKIVNSIETDNLYEPSVWWFHLFDFIQCLDKSESARSVKPKNLIEFANVQIKDGDEESIEYDEIYEPPKAKKAKQLILEEKLSSPMKEYDSYDYLAKVWADKLRKISSTQRIFVEKAINDVFFEAEMGTLERGSVKINESISFQPVFKESSSSIHLSSNSDVNLQI